MVTGILKISQSIPTRFNEEIHKENPTKIEKKPKKIAEGVSKDIVLVDPKKKSQRATNIFLRNFQRNFPRNFR